MLYLATQQGLLTSLSPAKTADSVVFVNLDPADKTRDVLRDGASRLLRTKGLTDKAVES